MRFHFQNLSRPKRVAKRFVRFVESLPLSLAQKWAANIYGYTDWNELRRVTERGTHAPSVDDEDLDADALKARLDEQAAIIAKLAGCPLPEARMLITMVAPTARNAPPLGEDPPEGESPSSLRSRGPMGGIADDLLALLQAQMRGEVSPLEFIARSAGALRELPEGMIDRIAEGMAAQDERSRAFANPTPKAQPLFVAMQHGHWKEALALLDADPALAHATSNTGDTVATLAMKRDQPEFIPRLQQYGADLNALDIEGFAPLHEAARTGRVHCVRALLAAKVDPNVRNGTGWTPLAMCMDQPAGSATEEDYSLCALALLDAGADPALANIGRISALSLMGTARIAEKVKAAIRRRVERGQPRSTATGASLPRSLEQLLLFMHAEAEGTLDSRLPAAELAIALAECDLAHARPATLDMVAGYLGPYLESGDPERQHAARQILETLAAHGATMAQCNLAMSLLRGQGGARDPDRARDLLRAAAQSPGASTKVLIYANLVYAGLVMGEFGTPGDPKEALACYRKAADLGSGEGAFSVALFYQGAVGNGAVAPDPAEAARYYRIAAKAGHTKAKTNLGILLYEHKSLALSLTEGVDMMLAAEAEGDDHAATLLDFMAREGQARWAQERTSDGMLDLRNLFRAGAPAHAPRPPRGGGGRRR